MIGVWFGVTRGEAPAVIQAIGSIGAIVVAVLVMQYQTKRAREERIEQRNFDDARKVNIIRSIFAAIEEVSKGQAEKFQKTEEVLLQKTKIEDVVADFGIAYFIDMKDAIGEIPLWEVPDHDLVIDFTIALRELNDFIQYVERAQRMIFKYKEEIEANCYNPYLEEDMQDACYVARNAFHDMHDLVSSVVRKCDDLLTRWEKA